MGPALADAERICLRELSRTEDMVEGLAAFADKRPPGLAPPLAGRAIAGEHRLPDPLAALAPDGPAGSLSGKPGVPRAIVSWWADRSARFGHGSRLLE